MFGFGLHTGLVQMIEIKHCIEYFGLYQAILFLSQKMFLVALIYAHNSQALGTHPAGLIFSGIFVAALSQK
jgi:hypothetical protein